MAYNRSSVVSANDCTGLIPGLPDDDESIDSVTNLYDVPDQGNLTDIEDSDKLMPQ